MFIQLLPIFALIAIGLPMCFYFALNLIIKSNLYQPNNNLNILNVDDKKLAKHFYHHEWKKFQNDLTFLNLWQQNRDDCPTMILLHGNASSIISMLSMSFKIYKSLGMNVVILTYPGYSGNKGSPSEYLIKQKLSKLIEYLLNNEIKNNNVYLYGISFGGAVAIYLTSLFQKHIKGLIVENTFLSVSEVINDLTNCSSWRKVEKFLNEKWNSSELISQIDIPILFICSTNDSVIDPRHMKELVSLTKHIHSVLKFDCDHNDVWEHHSNVDAILSAIEKFAY